MAQAKGFKHVGTIDCKGGGQVVVDRNVAYVGHVMGPEATTLIDVEDPKNPRLIETINLPWGKGVHSHKVRVKNEIMVTNVECASYTGKAPEDFVGGLNIYDVSNPRKPKHIRKWDCGFSGVHRYTFDGRYAYISPCADGWYHNIVMILDLKDPSKPEEVGRWWRKGQWHAGGEVPDWPNPEGHYVPKCHHPMRVGDRLYVSYWHGGFHILDISDMSKPKEIAALDWTQTYGWPCHTCLPIPYEMEGRKWMLVADECAVPNRKGADPAHAMIWMVDITDDTDPKVVSNFRVPGSAGSPLHTCHQPAEEVKGKEIPIAWFAYGLRMVDISDPFNMKEVGYFLPDPHRSANEVSSNDCCWDDRGLIYVIDRLGGLNIVERA
jgi:hypothetical protein